MNILDALERGIHNNLCQYLAEIAESIALVTEATAQAVYVVRCLSI